VNKPKMKVCARHAGCRPTD